MTIKNSFLLHLLLPVTVIVAAVFLVAYPWLTEHCASTVAYFSASDSPATRQEIAAAVAEKHLLLTAGAALLFTLIVLIAFRWCWRQLYLPLRSLNAQLEAFTRGEVVTAEPLRSDIAEFRRIQESLAEISEQLRHQYARQRVMQQSIENHRMYDQLTRLPNRSYLHHLITEQIRRNGDGGFFGLLYLDLDNFKMINDAMGYETGDELIKATAKRIYATLDDSDFMARIGGDEFVIVITGRSSREELSAVARNLLALMHDRFVVGGREFMISTSVGVSIYPDHGEDAALLLKHADIAMYEAKEMGRNDFCVYRSDMGERVRNQMYLEQEVREALQRREFSLFYQPQIDTVTSDVIGAEALIRWVHPEHGLISPVRFIELAEKTGFIFPLGEWILEEACAMIARHPEEMQYLKLSVNISTVQFRHASFVDRVREILAIHDTPPEKLVFEITETLLMANKEQSLATLLELKAMGISIAMDDFGTGYSSLAYLKNFPVDIIKIDKAFIQGAFDNSEDYNIVKAIITLGNELGLEVVAEGVETLYQYDFLRASHCRAIQGYLFSKPLPESSFLAYAREQHAQNQ